MGIKPECQSVKEGEDGKMETVNTNNSFTKFHCKREGEAVVAGGGHGVNKRLCLFEF